MSVRQFTRHVSSAQQHMWLVAFTQMESHVPWPYPSQAGGLRALPTSSLSWWSTLWAFPNSVGVEVHLNNEGTT